MKLLNFSIADVRQTAKVVAIFVLTLMVPIFITLMSIEHPGTRSVDFSIVSPLGYTISLTLFLVPATSMAWWFMRNPDFSFQKRAFRITLLILIPLGFVLDILFGNVFFEFLNPNATLGIRVPAVGESIPIEEFVFYLSGFAFVLLGYIWCDEYWLSAYNRLDYSEYSRQVPRLVAIDFRSVIIGLALFFGALAYKKFLSDVPSGWPSYFAYLVVASVVPSMAFYGTVRRFINWRAFVFVLVVTLLISLLWEATLGVPYGWWDYRHEAMMGIFIGAWSDLPIEAVLVWLAVTYTTVIAFETVKIWVASKRALVEALLGTGRR